MKTAANVSTVLSTLTQGTHYSDVKRFNATTQTWESYASSQFTQFEPGKGYNIIGLTSAAFAYGKTETTTTFVYDSTGARVKKTAGSTTTVYLGKDYDITGSLSTKYIFLGERRISMKESTGTTLYFHEDHINSSNVITESSGNQVALYEYDPYGSTVTHTGAASVKHQFTGQEKDDSTGLLYYNARYMDPQLGRFITADPTVQHPADPQDFNRYAYARNNPIRFTDPTGLGWLSKLFAFVAAVVVSYFTAGAGLAAFIAVTAAGTAGGLAGAAIEKSNLAKGAIGGAIIGAAVAVGSAVGGASGGGGAGGGGSGSASSVQITTSTSGIEGSTIINITGVAEAVGTTGASSTGTNVLWNSFGGVAWAATDEVSFNKNSQHKENNFKLRSFDPNYGNWGGTERSGGKTIGPGELGDVEVTAVDSLDAAYKGHDLDTYYYGTKMADERLVKSLNAMGDDPTKWPTSSKGFWNNIYARAHKNGAERYFENEVKKTQKELKELK